MRENGLEIKGVEPCRSLFDQPLCHICIGDLYLLVTRTGVGELFACVGVIQVLPDGRHLFGNVETSVLLSHNLKESTMVTSRP